MEAGVVLAKEEKGMKERLIFVSERGLGARTWALLGAVAAIIAVVVLMASSSTTPTKTVEQPVVLAAIEAATIEAMLVTEEDIPGWVENDRNRALLGAKRAEVYRQALCRNAPQVAVDCRDPAEHAMLTSPIGGRWESGALGAWAQK